MLRELLIKCHFNLTLFLHLRVVAFYPFLTSYRRGVVAAVKISRVASVSTVGIRVVVGRVRRRVRKSGVKARLSWPRVERAEGEITFRRIVQNGRCLTLHLLANTERCTVIFNKRSKHPVYNIYNSTFRTFYSRLSIPSTT